MLEMAGLEDGLPTTEQLLANGERLRIIQREWLQRCKELCSLKIPLAMYNLVPDTIWRAPVWGHKVLILHAPPIAKWGMIELSKDSQRETNYGWVLIVGDEICNSEGRQAPTGGSVCPYGDPLLLVGEFVLFNMAGIRKISFHISDGGPGQGVSPARVSLAMIGDIWLPIIDTKNEDWSAEQTGIILDSSGRVQ